MPVAAFARTIFEYRCLGFSRPLNSLSAPEEFTYDRVSRKSGARLSIHNPVTMLDHILHEFRKFVHFEEDEIDKELLQIDRNVGRELFINEIGSWKWRPHTRTKIKNLFLAGDYCKNAIDVVCLEGAVVSGLEAAECARVYCGQGSPIKIEKPKRYPYSMFGLEFMLAPYAAGAWAWSAYHDLARRLIPRDEACRSRLLNSKCSADLEIGQTYRHRMLYPPPRPRSSAG